MKNLNFLAGKDKDWIDRKFKILYKPKYDFEQERYLYYHSADEVDELQKNDVIFDRRNMRKYLTSKTGYFTFFTNFQFDHLQSERQKKNIYYYDIYDAMFDDDGKIVGAIRVPNRAEEPAIGQERYPVKYSRHQYALNFTDYSIFIGDIPMLFMNWNENPLEVKQ